MTFDISLEAIEADLALADRDPGGRLSNLALAKAQIRATLLAAGVLGPNIDQQWVMGATMQVTPEGALIHPFTQEQADAAADVASIIIDGPTDPVVTRAEAAILDYDATEDDEDDDFFAEARRERD